MKDYRHAKANQSNAVGSERFAGCQMCQHCRDRNAMSGTIAIAGSFNELSTSPPQVSVSPGTLVERQQATITASNYYPQGTTVNFNWVSLSNQVEFGINGTTSDSNGMAKVNFIVPVTSMES